MGCGGIDRESTPGGRATSPAVGSIPQAHEKIGTRIHEHLFETSGYRPRPLGKGGMAEYLLATQGVIEPQGGDWQLRSAEDETFQPAPFHRARRTSSSCLTTRRSSPSGDIDRLGRRSYYPATEFLPDGDLARQ